MDSYKHAVIEKSLKVRSKRMRNMKKRMIVAVVIATILPSIFSVFLLYRIRNLENEIYDLKNGQLSLDFEDNLNERNNLQNKDENSYNLDEDIVIQEDIKKDSSSLDDGNMEKSLLEDMDNKGYNEEDSTQVINANNNMESNVDNNKENVSQVIYNNENTDTTGEDKSIKDDKEMENVEISKEVYLTFDDGPSKFTEEILDMLAEYNAKATFFVIGKTDDNSLNMYKRIVDEGHTLGMHSYTHNYNQIYNSIEDFDKDFTKLRDLLYDTTGYLPTIFRFPGGSSNRVSKKKIGIFIDYLDDNSITYYDWNVVNGDATGVELSQDELTMNVINGVELHKRSIVLMHDTDKKELTVRSLKDILEILTKQNVTLLALNDEVKPIQQIKPNRSHRN